MVLCGTTTMEMARLALLRRSSSGREGSSTEDLVQWVRQQGGRLLPAVHLQHQNARGDLGLVATEAVQSGESLIALPPHIPLSLPIDEPALAALAQRVPGLLACFLASPLFFLLFVGYHQDFGSDFLFSWVIVFGKN